MAEKNIGRVVQVIGPVLDVEFDPESLPEIYNALSLKGTSESGQEISLVAEVQQHIGRGQVRAVAMSSTDGVTRGMDVVDTGRAISVPVGEAALGMNELEAAETHFRQAIRKAADTWHTPEGNHALVGLARLLAIRGDTEGAYRLGSFVLANSASWQWSKDNAADLLAEIKVELPPESISAARKWGNEKRFEEVASHYFH